LSSRLLNRLADAIQSANVYQPSTRSIRVDPVRAINRALREVGGRKIASLDEPELRRALRTFEGQ